MLTLRLSRRFSRNLKNYSTVAEVLDNQPTLRTEKPAGWDEALPFQAIPGTKPYPLVGNTPRFIPGIGEYGVEFAEFSKRLYNTYGDIVCLRGIFGREPMVFLFDAHDVEKLQVYRSEGPWPIRDALRVLVYYRTVTRKDLFKSGGLVAEQGDDWQQLRKAVNPVLMQPRVIKRYVTSVDEIARELVENMIYYSTLNVNREMPDDFLDELYKFSLEAVAVIAVDRRLGNLSRDFNATSQINRILTDVRTIFEQLFKLEFIPNPWRYYSTSDWKKYVAANDSLAETFMKYINEAEANLKDDTPDEEMSAFQKMLRINKNIAVTMTMDMLQAGIDTTGKTIAATLYFLAKYRGIQEKLREELKRILPNKNTTITPEVLNDAQYLKAVIKESMRIAPISVANVRVMVNDAVIKGYQIPKGSHVQMMHLFMCTEIGKYFKNPKQFVPERFLRSTKGELSHKTAHPFASLPFGFGPRSCVGQRLAQMEVEVAIARIVRDLYLEWVHPDPEFKMMLTFGIASPLKLKVSPVGD